MQHKNENTIHLIKEFGKQVKKKRETQGKSQRLLALEYELDSGNLNRIENGKIDPKLTMLWRISEALQIPLSELIKDLENEVKENFHIIEQ